MEYQIFAIGDSITYGKKDALGGWVDRLKIKLLDLANKNPDFSAMVYNLGISGDVSDSLLPRFTNEVLVRQKFYPSRQALCLIAFGANDAGFATLENDFAVPLKRYQQNILDTIELAKKHQIIPVLINITPVLASIENRVDGYGKFRNNNFVSQFNSELVKISQANQVLIIDVNSSFENSKFNLGQLFDADGLHPNTLGHELICEIVLEKLKGVIGLIQ